MHRPHSVRTAPRRLDYTHQGEAAALWQVRTEGLPELRALCLMPDHIHLLHAQDVAERLGALLSGDARRRNNRLGTTGPLWRHREHPEPVRGPARAAPSNAPSTSTPAAPA